MQAPRTDQGGSSQNPDEPVELRHFQFLSSHDEKHYWINLPKIGKYHWNQGPTSKYSVIEVGKKLYVAGGTFTGNYVRSTDMFNCYDPAEDRWIQLPSLERDRYSAAAVYLKGYIYVIGGIEDKLQQKHAVNDMERYDIIKKKWETLPLVGEASEYGFEKISAITFEGKIIVYGIVNNSCLMVYYPDRNVWKIIHEEEVACTQQPMLFKHKGQYYKILYMSEDDVNSSSHCLQKYHLLSVHALDIKTEGDGDGDTLSISVGEEFPQDDVPCDAFRINDEVFMIRKGLAYKIDAKLRPLQHGQPSRSLWPSR